jgi:3-isopropylmalate/(R)-2-methylmalate dehydratase small subunit
LTIDLERQIVQPPSGAPIGFDVEPFRKECLLGGLDEIGLTLRHTDKIRAFEAERLMKQPWLATSVR